MDHGIQTLSASKVVSIKRDDTDALMMEFPDFARAMYIAQLTGEGILRAWITSMGRRSSIERVAHLTCELYARARSTGQLDGQHLMMPLSQSVLADALRMTSVHINRVLRDLRGRGVMGMRRGSITVLDPLQLIEIAGFDQNYLHRRAIARAERH